MSSGVGGECAAVAACAPGISGDTCEGPVDANNGAAGDELNWYGGTARRRGVVYEGPGTEDSTGN